MSGWDETLENVKNGKADFHTGLAYSEKRAKSFVYSLPFYEIKGSFFFLRDKVHPSNLDFDS